MTIRSPEVKDHVPQGIEAQPVNSVFWVPRDRLRPNSYNPNKIPPPELRLLKVSILSDGWTQPIVVVLIEGSNQEYEVVDGYHRYWLAEDPEISALTGGLVPCALLRTDVSFHHRVMSTIRHNRARGVHHVLKMADIVHDMVESGIPRDQVIDLLQMEDEEVQRLLDRGNMLERGSADEFGKGWVPR